MSPLLRALVIAAVDAGLILALAWHARHQGDDWPRGWTRGIVTRSAGADSRFMRLQVNVRVEGFPAHDQYGRCRLEIRERELVCIYDRQHGREWVNWRDDAPRTRAVLARELRLEPAGTAQVPNAGDEVWVRVGLSTEGNLVAVGVRPATLESPLQSSESPRP